MSVTRFIPFAAVALSIYAGMHYLVYRSLQPLFGSTSAFKWIFILFMAGFPVIQVLSHGSALHPGLWVVRFSSFWLGIIFQLFIWYLVLGLALALAGLFHPVSPVLAKGLVAAVLGLTLVMSIAGLYEALRTPRVAHYTVDRSDRFRQGRVIRIAQLSDLHLGSSLGRDCLEGIARRTLEAKPDLILISGDLVDMDVRNLEGMVPLLKSLKAPLGTFAVTGNHEYYSGLDSFLESMDHCGIPVLRNRAVIVGGGFQVIGVDDLTSERMGLGTASENMAKALAGFNPSLPSVMMHHQPKRYEKAVERGVDLILSGHTHAGQIFPFQLFVGRAFKYISGFHRVGPVTDLLVSNGTGFWGPPIRTFAPAQIVVVDFKF